jgi:hypothetical protein
MVEIVFFSQILRLNSIGRSMIKKFLLDKVGYFRVESLVM